MTTVAYLRQSLDREADEYGVSRQREDITRLCQTRGWTVTREYVDNDESATPERRKGVARPKFAELFADVKAGRVSRIVVANADRLVRHNRELEDVIDACTKHNAVLVTAHGDLDLSSDQGRTVARILCSVARGEIERKSARHKRALGQRAERGEHWWASRPFGYTVPNPPPDGEKWTTKGQQIVLEPREADLLRQAYTDTLAGMSLYAIAAAWNDLGVLTPRGNRWRGAQLRQLLLSPRNAGLRTHKGEIVGEGDWPAIVDRDVYDGVKAILDDPKRVPGRTRARVHLLSGLARCYKCGTPVKSARTGGRNIYTCREPGCMAVARTAKPLEQLIIALVVERLSQPDFAEFLTNRDGTDMAELRHRAAALRAQITDAERDYDEGLIDGRRLKARIERVNEKLAPIEAQLTDTNKAHIFDGLIGVEDVAGSFDNLALDRQRAVVAALLDITLLAAGATGPKFNPTTVRWEWKT